MSDRIEVTATIKARDEASGVVEQVNRAFEGLQRTATNIGRSFSGMMNRGMFGGVRANLSAFGNALGGLGRQLSSVLAPLGALAGIAGGFAITQQIQAYVASNEELRQMAQVLGLNVRELAAWRSVAGQSDVSFDQLSSAFRRLNQNAREAAMGGNKDLLALFNRLGISLDGIRAGTQTGIDLLPQLADAFARQENAGTIAAMSAELFGKNMDQVAQMLRMGRGELLQMLAAQRDASTVTDDSVRAAHAFKEAQEAIGRVLTGIRNEIGVEVMPALQDLAEGFRDWLREAKPEIVRTLTEALQALIRTLRELDWAAIRQGATDAFQAISGFIDSVGGFKTVLMGMAGVSLAPLVSSLLTVVTTLTTLGAAMLTNPFMWAIAAIAGAAYLIYQNWDGISAFFTGLWQDVKDAFESVRNWFDESMSVFSAEPIRVAWQGLGQFFTDLWDGIVGTFQRALALITDIINGIVAAVKAVPDFIGGMRLDTGQQRYEGRRVTLPPDLQGPLPGRDGAYGFTPDFSPIQQLFPGAAGGAVPLGGPNLLQQAPSQAVEGEVRIGVDITGAPPGTTVRARSTGIAAQPEVGLSMQTANP